MEQISSESPESERRIDAVNFRYVLFLSNDLKGFPKLTNSFSMVAEVIQKHTEKGKPILGQYGVAPNRARELATQGLRLIAHSMYKNPNLKQYFKLGYPQYLP